MSRPQPLRPILSQATVTAGLAMSLSALPGSSPLAQQAAEELPPITVESTGVPANGLQAGTYLGRLPGSVQDTPQMIDVITPETLREQGVTTLDEALRRNVPGVTVSIGEGNGGMNGDQFRIRGLDAKGDIYVDGLRDFGVYTRDSFNYEAVEVLKGPSSESFGMGTTGGSINTVSKTPFFEDAYSGTAGAGNGPFGRATIDLNQTVTPNLAIRLNAMATRAEVVDREGVESKRWGIAPSIGLRLGTSTQASLAWLHQQNENVPDYGVPLVTRPGADVAKPVTEYGVDSKWYGKFSDEDDSTVDMLTGRVSHEVGDWLTLYNDSRLAFYERQFSTSAPQCNADCTAAFFGGGTTPLVTYGAGGGPSYHQDSWGAQNITTGVADVETGSFRHQFVGGLDLFYQSDKRDGYSLTGPKPPTDLYDPDPSDYGYELERSGNDKRASSKNLALFLSERFWLTDEVSLLGGVRWDNYWSQYKTTGSEHLNTDSSQINPKASLIWEPTPDQTYYLSYATSTSPPGQFVTSAPNPVNDATKDLDPEENESFELGAKVSLIEGRLGLSGSLFRIYKDQVTEQEPDGTIIASSSTRQRIQGVELGIQGRPVPGWSVNVNYTWLDGEIRGATNPDVVGNDVPNAPENAFALWTSYDLSTVLPTGPGRLTLGGGVTYQQGMYVNDANSARVPDNVSYDGVVAYEWENVRFALNGYNLSDRLNYSSTFGSRVVPAPGRTVLFTVGAIF